MPKRRRGRQLKVETSLAEAQAHQQQTINRYDWFVWLHSEIRQALEPWTCTDMLVSTQQARETIQTAIALLQELGDANINAYAKKLAKHEDELLAPLVWLEQQLAPHRQRLESGMEAAVMWAYRHWVELEKSGTGIKPIVVMIHP